jgi:hypothetical protein
MVGGKHFRGLRGLSDMIYTPLNMTCRIVRDDGDDYPVIELSDGRYITAHTDDLKDEVKS